MNVSSHQQWHTRRYAAEFAGTFVLVLFGVGASMVAAKTNAFDITGIAFAFGVIVGALIMAFGKISGAHINPAVTLAMWSQRHFPARDVAPYIIAQCAGAIGGSALLLVLFGPMGTVGTTRPIIGVVNTLLVEGAYSAVLAFVVFWLSADQRVARRYVPLIVGLTVFVGARVTGPLTGGSFNPARSLGPAVVNGVWTHQWIYWIAPIVGMWIGASAHRLLRTVLQPRAAMSDPSAKAAAVD